MSGRDQVTHLKAIEISLWPAQSPTGLVVQLCQDGWLDPPSGVSSCCALTSAHRDLGSTTRKDTKTLVSTDEIAASNSHAGVPLAPWTTLKF